MQGYQSYKNVISMTDVFENNFQKLITFLPIFLVVNNWEKSYVKGEINSFE